MNKKKILIGVLNVLKYVITLAIGALGGNFIS